MVSLMSPRSVLTTTSDGLALIPLVYLTTTSDGSALVSLDLSLGLPFRANCYVGYSSRNCLTSLPYVVPTAHYDCLALLAVAQSLLSMSHGWVPAPPVSLSVPSIASI